MLNFLNSIFTLFFSLNKKNNNTKKEIKKNKTSNSKIKKKEKANKTKNIMSEIKKISEHVSYKEATKSNTAIKFGIDNKPNELQLENMIILSENVFEPLRKHFDKPIGISSFFRSEELNNRIGGSKSSQHLANKGAAMDIDADMYGGITNKDIFDYIKDNLEFTQMIWEFGTDKEPNWVHVGYDANNLKKELLVAKRNSKGKTYYEFYKE